MGDARNPIRENQRNQTVQFRATRQDPIPIRVTELQLVDDLERRIETRRALTVHRDSVAVERLVVILDGTGPKSNKQGLVQGNADRRLIRIEAIPRNHQFPPDEDPGFAQEIDFQVPNFLL
jgi:Na+-transporting NADH:ubiquinone oxidoreductase subunit NqrC